MPPDTEAFFYRKRITHILIFFRGMPVMVLSIFYLDPQEKYSLTSLAAILLSATPILMVSPISKKTCC
jgi:phosphatidylserine synthase